MTKRRGYKVSDLALGRLQRRAQALLSAIAGAAQRLLPPDDLSRCYPRGRGREHFQKL